MGRPVLYPRMSGRSVEMQEGILEGIFPVERQRYNWELKEYETYTAYKFKILPTVSSRGFRWSPTTAKPVTIQIGENVTALTGP